MRARLEATLDAPEGPWWLRSLGQLVLILAWIPLFFEGGWQVAGACGSCFALYIFPLIPMRFGPRRVKLELSPGVVRIRGAGLKKHAHYTRFDNRRIDQPCTRQDAPNP